MTTDALRRQRRLRVLEITILTLGAAVGILNVLAGSLMVLVSVVTIAIMAWALRLNTKAVRRIKEAGRPRPDYALIARMEREVYGETFQHEGAPAFTLTIDPQVAELHAMMDDLAERATAAKRTPPCWHCGTPHARISGLCPDCYRMLKGWGVETRRPATCPQGHPDRLWAEGRGEVCPACDDARHARTRDEGEHRSNLRWN